VWPFRQFFSDSSDLILVIDIVLFAVDHWKSNIQESQGEHPNRTSRGRPRPSLDSPQLRSTCRFGIGLVLGTRYASRRGRSALPFWSFFGLHLPIFPVLLTLCSRALVGLTTGQDELAILAQSLMFNSILRQGSAIRVWVIWRNDHVHFSLLLGSSLRASF